MRMLITSIDFETSKAPRHFPWVPGSFPVCLGMLNSLGERKVWWFTHTELPIEDTRSYDDLAEEIKAELDRSDLIVAHNMKFENVWLSALNIDTINYQLFCTMVSEYLIRGQFGDLTGSKKGRLGLNDLAARYGVHGKKDRVAEYWEVGYETDEIPIHILDEYVIQDCQIALTIARKQRVRLKELGMTKLAKVHNQLVKTLSDIEQNGMLLDRAMLTEFDGGYERDLEAIDRDIHELVELSPEWNIGSNEHISALLYGGSITVDGTETVERELKGGRIKTYERKAKITVEIKNLGFKPPRGATTKKDGVYKTDSDTLSQLTSKNHTAMKVLGLLKEYALTSKQRSTYTQGLLERQGEDGYVHPSMNQTITSTGRMSSSNPNGQNFPRGSTSPIKKAFISRYA